MPVTIQNPIRRTQFYMALNSYKCHYNKYKTQEDNNMSKVVVMDHPLIEQKIGIIRRKETGTKDFRQNISEIAMLIGYEATKDLKLEEVEIETPICKTTVKQ